jgi:small subunit ribosomal protein S7
MPRKGPAVKTPVISDPVYNSPVVTSLINKLLMHGKRSTAEAIVYGALEGCREKTQVDPIITLKRALENIKPAVEVRSRRVGGATYQVPVEVKAGRSTTLALRWLVDFSRLRREKSMAERLQNELMRAMALVLLLSVAKIPTKWRKQTRRLLTTAGNHKNPTN